MNTNTQREALLAAMKTATEKGTRVGPNSKAMLDYKNSLPLSLTQHQLEVAIGNMLGDAYLQGNSKSTQYRLRFEWGGVNFAYANYIYSVFIMYCLSEPREQVRTNALGNPAAAGPFQTVFHSAFNVLAEMFLVNGAKTINVDLIWDMFTPVSLAHWYMDDGELLKNRYSTTLHTQGFTPTEVESLCHMLRTKYGLECWVKIKPSSGKPELRISGNSY